MRSVLFVLAAIVGLTALWIAEAGALEGREIVESRCVSCHNVTGPAPTTFDGVLQRKAPDLFYAGSKFNRAWLVDWIQHPTIIRRAGMMYLNHIATDEGKDRIAEQTIAPCPANLDPQEAEAVADYLMSLTDAAMKAGFVNPATELREHKAFQMFTKQLPCIGCHTIKFRNKTMGGVSGPDLTNAGERLNLDWIYARIENPQYWDPKTWMPRVEMSQEKRETLALFLATMK